MALTYNQIIKRIQSLALAHRQIRYFGRGLITDFLTDKTIPYAAVFLEDGGGTINPDLHSATFSFRIRFVDLVHVSEDTKENELDVLSDMFSVAMDIVAQMKYPAYNDWIISGTNNLQRIVEEDGDMYAGWYMDFSVRIQYDQNVCEVPTTIPGYEPEIPEDMKLVYNHYYTADGTEGSTLTTCGVDANLASAAPTICGKKILLIIRGYWKLDMVSNLPASDEFTWDNSEIGLGIEPLPGEKFLILYRAY
jgi:hypothetical protein